MRERERERERERVLSRGSVTWRVNGGREEKGEEGREGSKG